MRKKLKIGCLRPLLIGMVFALFGFGMAPVAAAASNLSYSYRAVGRIPNGSLVSLDSGQSKAVVPANSSNDAGLLGVAVNSSDSLLAVDPSAGPTNIQVATAGSASALVSTLNGNIHVGDQIGVSPFDGIGIKALPGSRVIGVAQTAFSSQTSGAVSESATDNNGKTDIITVGYVEVNIAIGTSAGGSSGSLTVLQKTAKAITGHTVSTLRVILGIMVAIIACLTLVTLIYGSIYGSLISIGRNPLAKYAIFRTLSSVLAIVFATAIVAGLTIYLLLN